MAEALANGARGVNQRLPPIPPKDLAARYREMCQFILYGGAEIGVTGKREPPKSKMLKHR
jgi:hypothetical protein